MTARTKESSMEFVRNYVFFVITITIGNDCSVIWPIEKCSGIWCLMIFLVYAIMLFFFLKMKKFQVINSSNPFLIYFRRTSRWLQRNNWLPMLISTFKTLCNVFYVLVNYVVLNSWPSKSQSYVFQGYLLVFWYRNHPYSSI